MLFNENKVNSYAYIPLLIIKMKLDTFDLVY
jgi:hypothetical protein